MTNDNQEIVTTEDHELFRDIAKEIRNNPDKYLETGKWLDKYCSEEAYWHRQEDKLHKIGRDSSFNTYWEAWNEQCLEQEIKERRTPALMIRFQKARNYLLEKYEDQQFIPEEDAKCIILTTWLLTDPDSEKTNLGITKLEKWAWEPIDDVTKLSRGYANFLWFYGGKVYVPWMNLVRISWSKLSEGMDETVSLSTEVAKQKFAKNFLNNLLRASIKHLPFFGSFLYDVIYGTFDSQASHKEKIRQPKTPQSDAIFEKHKTVAKHKQYVEKTYHSISLKVAKITLYAAIITLVGAISTSPLWRPIVEKWTGESSGIKKIPTEKKLHISLKEICEDIDSRPLLQKEQTAKSYVGMPVKRESLSLFEITPEEESFLMLMVFPGESYRPFLGGWGVSFRIKKNDYPELAGAKKGLQLYVSGLIEDAGKRYIHLSDVSLSTD